MKTLVFLETVDGKLHAGSLGVLSRAAKLGGEVAGVVIGSGVAGLAEGAGAFGAQVVYVADDARLASALPQPRVDVIAGLVSAQGFDNVLFAQSVLASDLAAGLAARLEAGVNWDLGGIEERGGELIGTRAALGDSVYVEVGWKGTPRIGIVRSGTYAAEETGGSARVENAAVELQDFSTAAVLVSQDRAEQSGPSIEEAEIIVAGGRGLGAAEHFKLAEELAEVLGGAVASTRAVVDAGWYPYATQVGQTGKTITPKLYIGLGISGAIQHKVGMQGSGTIVSINKDGHAPIFDYSDLGVVGDLHTIVPKLVELLRARG